eukprot:gene30629-38111_t
MRPAFITTIVLIAAGIVRVYDLVVALTDGGPGNASEVPAKYVYEFMFRRANLGQGLAASTIMLTTVLITAAEPRGKRPTTTFAPSTIMIYGVLLVAAIYYLLPLYVMIVTSLKGMPEIRL